MPKPPTEQSSSTVTVAATSSQNEVPPTPVTPDTGDSGGLDIATQPDEAGHLCR